CSLLVAHTDGAEADDVSIGPILFHRPLSNRRRAETLLQVRADHLRRGSVAKDPAAVEENRSLTEAGDRRHAVGNEQDGASLPTDVLHLAETLLLKRSVSDGQDLVDDQDLGLE